MEIIIFVSSTIIFLYSLLILALIAGFYNIVEETYTTEKPKNNFTILVPFRNESENIEKLIESFVKLDYHRDNFEVVFIDDHSEDNSKVLVDTLMKYSDLNFKDLSLGDLAKGKKDALSMGVNSSRFKWIITTDADCIVPRLWLKLFDQKIRQSDTVMIAGPISYKSDNNSFIDLFQKCDLSATMGTTIGGFGLKKPFLCNGANLLFSKNTFLQVDGYNGNNDQASGDDIFLLEKIASKFPDKVKYLKAKDAIVYTNTVKTYSEFIHQRVRWAAKSSSYNSSTIKLVSVTVGAANIMLILLIALSFYGNHLSKIFTIIFLKVFVDFWLIKATSFFLENSKKIYKYPIVALMFPFYVANIFILSQITTFKWKGRTHKK